MIESEFFVYTDALFTLIEAQIDAADIDVEMNSTDGIVELEFADKSKIIINRHMVNQEIWIAARGGGFHYQLNGMTWNNTRTGEELLGELAKHISQQAKIHFTFNV